MNERIVINAKNMNIEQGNTNNGTVCIGDNNSNNTAIQTPNKKRKQQLKNQRFLLFMDMMMQQNWKSPGL